MGGIKVKDLGRGMLASIVPSRPDSSTKGPCKGRQVRLM